MTTQFYPADPGVAPQEAVDALIASRPLARLGGYPDVREKREFAGSFRPPRTFLIIPLHFSFRRRISHTQIKVVLSTAHNPATHVAVICGGGSGHEPFATGYTGPGLLAAAVAGPTFASPPASAVRAAIHAVTSPEKGALVLVMSYLGDKIHFGRGIEDARAAGLPVSVVTMGDDVALLPPGSGDDPSDPAYVKARALARGIAGSMLTQKIAGAAAAAGKALAEVEAIARAAAAAVASMGVATRPCTMRSSPAAAPGSRPLPGCVTPWQASCM